MSLYKTFLSYGKTVLFNYLQSTGVNQQFRTIQSAASYLSKNYSEDDLRKLNPFAKRYLSERFSSLNLSEMKVALRFMKLNERYLDNDEISTIARTLLRRDHQDNRLRLENRFKACYKAQDNKNVNGTMKTITNLYVHEELPVNNEFKEIIIDRSVDNKIDLEVNLDGSEAMTRNMVHFMWNNVLNEMNFADRLKVIFITDDGSHHYEYFDVDNIEDLYLKFSDEKWNIVTNEICPTEGSDMLILHIDYKRIVQIRFILTKKILFTPLKRNRNSGCSAIANSFTSPESDVMVDEFFKAQDASTQLRSTTEAIKDLSTGDAHGQEYSTRAGSFFRYFAKTEVDLTKFQIFNKYTKQNIHLADDHCLVYAFKQSGLDKNRIDRAKQLIARCNFKIVDLEDLARELNLKINLKYYNLNEDWSQSSHFSTMKYPAKSRSNKNDKAPVVNLVCIDKHYMIDEKIRFNRFYLEHEEEINRRINTLFNTNSKLAIEYEKKKNLVCKLGKDNCLKFYQDENAIPTFTIYEVLFALKKAGRLTDIPVIEYWTLYGSIRKEKLAESNEIPESTNYEFQAYKARSLNLDKVKTNVKHQYLVFADFEASTDGVMHKEYCICARKYQMEVIPDLRSISHENKVVLNKYQISDTFDSFASYSEDCATQFLDWLDNDSTVYFHNLKYDIDFILRHADSVMSSLIFHGKDMNHNILYDNKQITFKDSYCLINTKLCNFPGMFKLDCGEKEAFPYNYYSSTNAFKATSTEVKYGNINDALRSFEDEDNKHEDLKNQFLINVNKIEGIKIDENLFDMEKYALFYCEQDVRILAEGVIKFNTMCREALNIDCLNSVSISGLANKYFEHHVYFKNNNIYKVGGNVRKFIMKSIYGGRCMVRDNEMFKLIKILCDFDAVSLYPSAVKRAYILEGKAKKIPDKWTKEFIMNHLFDDDQVKPTKEKFISGFFVKIRITKVNKPLHMPLIFNKFDETLPLNTNECCVMYVNHITLQDLIRFQEIEYEMLGGYYYADGRDTTCQDVIQYLFDKRKEFKAQKNPIEQIFKLVMNSVYGKTIMKPINSKSKIVVGEQAFLKYERKNYNHIMSVDKLYGSDTYQVKTIESLIKDFNLAQFGSIILSMSKRIISEVFCLAEELGHTIYYTDTDSGHFCESEIDELASEFKKRYGRELIGSNLGQFHCDFENIENDASMPVSVKSFFLGKKSYIDMLQDDKQNIAFHVRMKGIPADCLVRTANSLFPDSIPVKLAGGLFKPEINEGPDASYSIFELYKYLFDGNAIEFELVSASTPRFQFNNNRTITSKKSFTRNIHIQGKVNELF